MLPKWWFLIFWFVLLFFGIFRYELGRNSSERFFLFSLFLGLSKLILAGKVSKIVVFSFFNFFCYFLEFSITSWVGTHRNDFFLFLFFFFLSFSAFPNLFWLGKMQQWCFLIFLNFLLFVFEFSITGQVGTPRNDFFFFSLSRPSPTYFGLERSNNRVF